MSAGRAAEFLEAAMWHGGLEKAEAMLREDPSLADHSIHTAAVLGDDARVGAWLARDPALVHATAPPHGGDALNYLCLSKYLRLRPGQTPAFLRAATLLLDAGADPNTGFWTPPPNPEHETALYGAAGVAHHRAMTQLLLSRGADPNDGEAVYHSPESGDNGAMQALVETGKVTPESLSLMVIRKHDWHDYDGLKWLLEHGADPRRPRRRGWSPFHHGLARDNGREMLELLLDHGADPHEVQDGLTGIARAAHRGRGDVLAMLQRRGIALELEGVDYFLAMCALDRKDEVARVRRNEPATIAAVLAMGADRLAEFAGTWNTEGVGHLLDTGVPVDARYGGDGYFGVSKESTALHVAAWKGVAATVGFLLARGADVHARDGDGRTALMLAVKATVDSYWTERRSPESIRMLLAAGASVDGVKYPSGYAEADALLAAYGAR